MSNLLPGEVFAGEQVAHRPLLWQLEESDQRACGQVRAVRDRPFHRSAHDDDGHTPYPRQEYAIEERLRRRQWAEQKADEGYELDVTEPHRLRLEDQRAADG